MSLAILPLELVASILFWAVKLHPKPADVLSVNSAFYRLGQPLLYSELRFCSSAQIESFYISPWHTVPLTRTIFVDLAGSDANYKTPAYIYHALVKCRDARKQKQVDLESLQLRLNSHERNPDLGLIQAALSLANPAQFVWTGPDPDHHFSIAIVRSAVQPLFSAFRTWMNIQHIKLTNVSFPSSYVPDDDDTADPPTVLQFPVLRTLRTLYIGQATHLHPATVAAVALAPGMSALESVTVVDAYSLSIWGLRIRRSDVEKAAFSLVGEADATSAVARIRQIVSCQAKTERIMGGDRVEGTVHLV